MASKKIEIPDIPSDYIIELKNAPGKKFIKAEGLIYLGHLQGFKRTRTVIIKQPTKDDPSAIVFCEVTTDLGVFEALGEVNPQNKGAVGGSYPLSLAETRARNRALRQATNCPLTSYEEMDNTPDDNIVQRAPSAAPAPAPRPAPVKPPVAAKPAAPVPAPEVGPISANPVTPQQLHRLHTLEEYLGKEPTVPGPNSTFETIAVLIQNTQAEYNERADASIAQAARGNAVGSEDDAELGMVYEQMRLIASQVLNEFGKEVPIAQGLGLAAAKAERDDMQAKLERSRAKRAAAAETAAVPL